MKASREWWCFIPSGQEGPLLLSRDRKEVREEVTQITETGVFQRAGTVSVKPRSSSVLGGASRKDRTAGVREGGTVGPCDHSLTKTHTGHLL